MNMPDVEALQELMSEMGAMDYEELKKRKRGMPGMTKIEIESNQAIDPQKVAEAVKGGGMGQMSEKEDEMGGSCPACGQSGSEGECAKCRMEKMMKMRNMKGGGMGQVSDREMSMMEE